jgi:hypothetical protein
MLCVIMLSVIMLSVIMLNIVMLNVTAPEICLPVICKLTHFANIKKSSSLQCFSYRERVIDIDYLSSKWK